MREIQPEPSEPGHCQRWVGQACQGMRFTSFFPFFGEEDGDEERFCQRMLCNLEIFATSEPSSYETKQSPMH